MSSYTLPDPKNFIGQYDNKNTHLIILQNSTGIKVALSDYGARIISIIVPDKHGDPTDVVLGFDSINSYKNAKEKYHGVTVGRYANRIAKGKFSIDNQEYQLPCNNGENCLHGGDRGFHDHVWDRQVSFERKVDFYYVSPDGEEGFPGNMKVHVSYELTHENELKIKFRAVSDKKTIVNLTNHAYFNLNGEGNGDILSHNFLIPSEYYLPVDQHQIPTGEKAPVIDTPFDLRTAKKIAESAQLDHEQFRIAKGFDHTYINEQPFSLSAATALSEHSGIQLDVFTTEPSVHFYTGNHLDNGDIGKSGQKYLAYSGFCFEAQHYPDSINQSAFPSVILEKGKEFIAETTYKFSLVKNI